MPAAAHVIALGLEEHLNKGITAWFQQFNVLPPIPLTPGRVDTVKGPPSFENLLSLIAASSHKNFILIVHGHEDGSGLYLKLAHSGKSTVGTQRTEHHHLQRLMDLDAGKLSVSERAKLGIGGKEIGQLVDLMRKVRGKKIDCVEFRACNLGRNKLSLERFREFLGARLVGAPDLHTFFGQGPVVVQADVQAHVERHKRDKRGAWETYNFPNAFTQRPDLQCCFLVNRAHKPEGGHVVADSQDTVKAWIRKYVMPGGSQPEGEMALHGMWVTGRHIIIEPEDRSEPLGGFGGPVPRRVIFPLSPNYRAHVIYARAP